jgi:hypothetical protein
MLTDQNSIQKEIKSRLRHVESSMNGGIINSVARLHLVGYFS